MSALFHSYLCGRIAAEWLINMTRFQKFWLIALLGFVIVCIVIVFLLSRNFSTQNPAITLNNGKSYNYFEYPSEKKYWVNGIDLTSAPLTQVLRILDDDLHPMLASGTITSAEQAAYYGASILDEVFKEWTQVDEVGVFHNKTARVWVVHGVLKDRYSHANVGVIVLDATTGEVIGVTLNHPSTQS